MDGCTFARLLFRVSPPPMFLPLRAFRYGHTNAMITRGVIYGVLGWLIEILWTGTGSILRRDPRLRATTYLWMFPIYAFGGLLCERLHGLIRGQPWVLRGLAWTVAIFTIEYCTGRLIRAWVGQSPWNYDGAPLAVDGLIRLDYAPAWFLLGLGFERVHDALRTVLPVVPP